MDPAGYEQHRVGLTFAGRWVIGLLVVGAVGAAVVVTVLGGDRDADVAVHGPPVAVAGEATWLVHTDGRRIVVSDHDGKTVREVDVPAGDDGRSIRRVALRPGSVPDRLVVAYLRDDGDCNRTELRWVSVDGAGSASGLLDDGGRGCVTDPVWAPDGSVVAWVRRQPPRGEAGEPPPAAGGDLHVLLLRAWFDEGPDPDEPHLSNQHALLQLDEPEAVWSPVRSLHPTRWSREGGLTLSAVHQDGRVRAVGIRSITAPIERHRSYELATVEGVGYPSVPVYSHFAPEDRRLATVGGGRRTHLVYSLVALPDGRVRLDRTDYYPRPPLRLPSEVVDRVQDDDSVVWLSAGGDLVAFGAGDAAWTVLFEPDRGDEGGWGTPRSLPGVVHADVMLTSPDAPSPSVAVRDPYGPRPVALPAPETSPDELPVVATDGEVIALHAPDGRVELVRAGGTTITAFALRPGSTPDDLTLVWRQGSGCDATLQWVQVVESSTADGGSLPATCPGRPVFDPEGRHLVWVMQHDEGEPATFTLEALDWSDGPSPETTEFVLRPDPPQLASLDLVDWEWREGPGTRILTDVRGGILHLLGSDRRGRLEAPFAGLQRHEDPAGPRLELGGEGVPQRQPPSLVMTAMGHRPDGTLSDISYVLSRDADEGQLRLSRSADGEEVADTELPGDLFPARGDAAAVERPWMSASGHHVLLGDGTGRAWRLTWTASGWSQRYELDGDVRYAVAMLAEEVMWEP